MTPDVKADRFPVIDQRWDAVRTAAGPSSESREELSRGTPSVSRGRPRASQRSSRTSKWIRRRCEVQNITAALLLPSRLFALRQKALRGAVALRPPLGR